MLNVSDRLQFAMERPPMMNVQVRDHNMAPGFSRADPPGWCSRHRFTLSAGSGRRPEESL